MTLNKRYLRNLKSNLSFYLCIVILTALISTLYICLVAGFNKEKSEYERLAKKSFVEDGQFVTATAMSDDDIKRYEDTYDVLIEPMEYKDIKTEDGSSDITLRFLANTKKINKSIVTYGTKPEADNEIAISKNFADKNNLSLKDTISIGGKKFKITGFFLRWDYLFCLEGLNDTFSSNHFGVAMVNEDEYENLDQDKQSSYYSIIYHKSNEIEVRKKLYEDFYIMSYTPTSGNARIVVPKDQIDELKSYVDFILPICIILMMGLIIVVLGRKINNEKKMIGILTALGYKRSMLARHYSLFGAIPGVIGSVLGILIGIPLMPNVAGSIFENKIEQFNITYTPDTKSLILTLLLPTIAYTITVYLTAFKVMKGNVINMIKGLSEKKQRHTMRMVHSKLSFRTKYKLRAIFGNLNRSLVVILGITIGGLLLSFGYACNDSIDRYVDRSVDQSGSFEYEYFLNKLYNLNDTLDFEIGSGKTAMVSNMSVKGHEDLTTIMGTDDNSYLNYKDESGKSLKLERGKFYISDMCSTMYGVKVGDILKMRDVASLKEYKIIIAGIFKNGSQNLIISDAETVCNIINVPNGSFNLVVSVDKLDIPSSDILKTLSKQGLKEQIDTNISESMHQMMAPIIVFGGIILIISVFLMVNILLTESTQTISMLKVLGYHDREINNIVTHIYHALVPIGIVLGLLVGYYLNMYNFKASVENYNTYIESYMSVISIVKYTLIVLVSYVLSLIFLSRKVGRISMVESLKNTSE